MTQIEHVSYLLMPTTVGTMILMIAIWLHSIFDSEMSLQSPHNM